jgi:membrane-associated phospholipid phosphatase
VEDVQARLVTQGMVRPVVVIVVACAAVVLGLGLLFHHQRDGLPLDHAVYGMVYRNFVGERGLLQAMLVPTEPVLLVIVVALFVMLAVARRRPRVALLAVVGPLLAVGLNAVVFKPLVDRTINNGNLAYPSGHTTGLVAVLTVLVLATVTSRVPKPLVSLVIIVALVVTVVAATALVGMKYHYVTDTVGGACLAVATVLGVALAIDAGAAKRGRVGKTAASGVAL